MAYINQEQKAKIKKAIQGFIPKDWKFSLSIKDNMKIVCWIKSAPFDIESIITPEYFVYNGSNVDYLNINVHQPLESRFLECQERDILKKIIEALNIDNYDNSDIQSDYFDVGHYVGLTLGKYDKPFVKN